jgi:hypothetical protein
VRELVVKKPVKLSEYMQSALKDLKLHAPKKYPGSHHPTGVGSTALRKKYRTGQHELYKGEWEDGQ